MADRDNRALAWMRAVRECDLESTTKLVLLTLGTRMDPNGGNCFPSTRTLAADTGLHRNTVERHLRDADEAGWLERRERGRDDRVRWRSYQYLPRVPTLGAEDPQALGGGGPPSGDDLGGSALPTLGAQRPLTSSSTSTETDGGDLGGGEPPSREYPPPSDLPKNESGQYQYPDAFERVWEIYPDREGGNSKLGAYGAWRTRVTNGASPDNLEAGTRRYAAFCNAKERTGTEYVKQAQTFYGPKEWWKESWSVGGNTGDDPRYELPWEGS